jgi:hypothetical protein
MNLAYPSWEKLKAPGDAHGYILMSYLQTLPAGWKNLCDAQSVYEQLNCTSTYFFLLFLKKASFGNLYPFPSSL